MPLLFSADRAQRGKNLCQKARMVAEMWQAKLGCLGPCALDSLGICAAPSPRVTLVPMHYCWPPSTLYPAGQAQRRAQGATCAIAALMPCGAAPVRLSQEQQPRL